MKGVRRDDVGPAQAITDQLLGHQRAAQPYVAQQPPVVVAVSGVGFQGDCAAVNQRL